MRHFFILFLHPYNHLRNVVSGRLLMDLAASFKTNDKIGQRLICWLRRQTGRLHCQNLRVSNSEFVLLRDEKNNKNWSSSGICGL